MRKESASPLYALVAEFDNPEDITVAAHKVREAGYRRVDAYTPFPVHGLVEALGWKDNRLPWIIFFGGLFGCIGGFMLCAYASYWMYPINVGGRPYIAWPSFLPVTFECTILVSAFAAVFGMIGLNGLPRPHHPIFNAPRFDLASRERFFLAIEASDPQFKHDETWAFLESLGGTHVAEVPA